MVQIKANEIDRYIANHKDHHAVILVYGPDQGLASERVSAIVKAALQGNDDPFALQTLDSDEIANDPGRLADEAASIALFGGDKVIRIRLNSSRSIAKSVQAVLDTPSPGTRIILEAGDLRKDNTIRSLIEKSRAAAALPCFADDRRSLRSLILSETETISAHLSGPALNRLQALLGEDRATSRNELTKLALFAHDRAEITETDIDMLIGDASASLSNETVDAVMSGNVRLALDHFERGLTMGTDAFVTASTLQRHLTQLQLMAAEIAAGAPARSVVDRVRPPLFFSRKAAVEAQLRIWHGADIVKALDYTLEAIGESRMRPLLADTIIHALLLRIGATAARKSSR